MKQQLPSLVCGWQQHVKLKMRMLGLERGLCLRAHTALPEDLSLVAITQATPWAPIQMYKNK